jgi:lipoic acid synthetase
MATRTEKPESNDLRIQDCGLADYRTILTLQQQLHRKRLNGEIANTVLIVEHRPVITLGARESANRLLSTVAELAARGIDVVEIRRGGGVTAHNPSQLVFYPILHLPDFGLGVSEYVRKLEAIGIELLAQLGVTAQRRKGFPGLWVGERKIASIGVRVSKMVSYHGMAINIANDLAIFDYLVPCGLDGVEMTSVQRETGKPCAVHDAKSILTELLNKHFSTRTPADTVRGGCRLPPWLRRPLPAGGTYQHTSEVLNSLGLNTICENANCPNRGECWSRGTATVLTLGNICTRRCRFCSVATGKPHPPDPTEPARIAEMAKRMNLQYLVITSVNRDDLPDGGAGHFRNCILEVRRCCPQIRFEILTPDFRNCQTEAVEILRDALPFVFAHNVETVPSLYTSARMGGDYQRSLNLLLIAKQSYKSVPTKSSIMLGLGETDAEVEQVLRDLRSVGCDRLTIGQYLKPSKESLEVVEYVRPEKFDEWGRKALDLGFAWVISAPFARSSYFAEMTTTV